MKPLRCVSGINCTCTNPCLHMQMTWSFFRLYPYTVYLQNEVDTVLLVQQLLDTQIAFEVYVKEQFNKLHSTLEDLLLMSPGPFTSTGPFTPTMSSGPSSLIDSQQQLSVINSPLASTPRSSLKNKHDTPKRGGGKKLLGNSSYPKQKLFMCKLCQECGGEDIHTSRAVEVEFWHSTQKRCPTSMTSPLNTILPILQRQLGCLY